MLNLLAYLHRFKDDVQDVLDYLDDEPIPTCNAGFFEYDLAMSKVLQSIMIINWKAFVAMPSKVKLS